MSYTPTKEQEEIIEALRKEGFEIIIEGDKEIDTLYVKDASRKTLKSARILTYENIRLVHPIDVLPFYLKKEMIDLIKLLEIDAKNNQKYFMFGYFPFRNGSEKLKTYIEENYTAIDDSMIENLTGNKRHEMHKDKTFVKKENVSTVYEEVEWIHAFDLAIEELEKAKAGFRIDQYEGQISIDFYYLGYEGILSAKIKEGKMFLMESKKEYVVENREEIKSVLEKLLEDVKKKTRLRSIYEPPMDYFNELCDTIFIGEVIRGTEEVLYASLQEVYSAIEIDEYTSKIIKEKKYYFMDTENILLHSKGFLFYVNTLESKVVRMEKTKENERKIVEMVQKKVNNKLTELFK